MLHKGTRSTAITVALLAWLTCMPMGPAGAQEKAAPPSGPQVKPTMAKICTNCHKPEADGLRGNFDSVAYKTQSIQIKIDESAEILRFDKDSLKVLNVQADPANPEEPLRAIKKGREVHVQFTEKDGKKFATLVIAKPVVKLPAEKLIYTADVEKLVAMGPEKGKYLLIDARPAPKFMEGAVPTAINIPFPAFDKMVDKLPRDKNALIVYYCGGMT